MSKCKKFVVSLEDIIYAAEGYELSTTGWNGWACPGFEKDMAEFVLTQLKAGVNYLIAVGLLTNVYICLGVSPNWGTLVSCASGSLFIYLMLEPKS